MSSAQPTATYGIEGFDSSHKVAVTRYIGDPLAGITQISWHIIGIAGGHLGVMGIAYGGGGAAGYKEIPPQTPIWPSG
eukprot:441234-Prorocentrum_minimum.AAC.1